MPQQVSSNFTGQDDDYHPVNPKSQRVKRVAIFSLVLLGICGIAMSFSTPEDEAVNLQQQTLMSAIQATIATGDFYKIQSVGRPNFYLYMQSHAHAGVHGINNENEGDAMYWYFTKVPGTKKQYVITNKKWADYNLHQRSNTIWYPGNIDGKKGDPGPEGYFIVNVVNTGNNFEVVTFQTRNRPGYFQYLTDHPTDPVFTTWNEKGVVPKNGRFRKILMTDKLKLKIIADPFPDWRFVESFPAVPKGVKRNITIEFEKIATTSFKIQKQIDVEYINVQTSLNIEVAHSNSQASRYTKNEIWRGPIKAQRCFRQVVVIPVARGNVTIPTSHVACIGPKQNIYKAAQFIPLYQLGKLTITNQFGQEQEIQTLFSVNDEFSNDIEVFEAENYENEDMKTFEDEEEENLTVEQDDDSTSLVKEDDLTFENQEQEEEITIIEDDVSLE